MKNVPDHGYVLAANHTIINKVQDQRPGHRQTKYKEGGGWSRKFAVRPEALRDCLCHRGEAVMGVKLGDLAWPDEPRSLRVKQDTNNVLGSSLFALDFDNDQSLWTDIHEALNDPILSTAALIYETPSSRLKTAGRPRFRCFWWLPRLFERAEHYTLANQMISLWHGTDRACSNPNRVFYGHRDTAAIIHQPHAVLDVDAVAVRYEGAVEQGLISPSGFNGDFDFDYLEGVPGQYGCYIKGLFDAHVDEIGLATACLQFIPPRRMPGESSTGIEYSEAFRVVMGLLNVFGPELALEIIESAGWHSPYWDIDSVVNGACQYIGKPTNQGRKPADLGSLIHRAKNFGMTRDEIALFRR